MSVSIFEAVATARRHPVGRYVFFIAVVHGLLVGIGFAIGVYTSAEVLNGQSAVRLALAVATGLGIGQLWAFHLPFNGNLWDGPQMFSGYEQLRNQGEDSAILNWLGTIRGFGILAGIGATTWPYTFEGVLFGMRESALLVLLLGLTLLFGSGVLIGSLLDDSELVAGIQTIAAGIAVVGITWLLP